MMPASPCKGCQERRLHCHSSCEKYLLYRQKIEENKNERHNCTEENAFFFDIKRPIHKRYDRRRKGDDK